MSDAAGMIWPSGPDHLPPPGLMRMGLRPLMDAPIFLPALASDDRLKLKRRLWAREGRRVLDFEPGTADALAELRAFVETQTGKAVSAAVPPLPAAGLAVGEDLCLLQEQADGTYRLTAGAVFFPAGWRLDEKLGKSLGGVHAPVPGFAEQLLTPTERVFQNITPEAPLTRDNWGITESLDLFRPGGHAPAEGPLYLRTERQTLSRLPETGAVLFAIGTFMAPLKEVVAQQPAWADYLLGMLEAGEADHLAYKGLKMREAQIRDLLTKQR